jgi:tetratricopeptide (TPR) repeat protein
MRRGKLVVMAVVALLGLGTYSCAQQSRPPRPETSGPPQTLVDWAAGAQLFDGLGDFHRRVTTTSPEAQQYVDQGMRYLWAFNHDESTRSFAKAAQLDPACAMCYWGVALTVGPNYNVPFMAEPRAKAAWEAVQLAQQTGTHTTPVEQALVGAVSKRYNGPQPLDPSNEGPVLKAYAEAMKGVAKQFPDDLDVQTLYAEAMMNLNPWKLWTSEGKPAPGTEELVATLEAVMKQNPDHPGANHYYIHAMEASPHPEKALACAERLRGMMPAAGHLQHMPAHIMQRVGRYEDAAEANREGAAADATYYTKAKPLDYYAMYTGHNYQFLAFSTAMEGRKAETLEAVRKSRETISDEMLLAMPGFDWLIAERYAAMVRFGLWGDMLAEPEPNAKLPGLTGGYLFGKAVALAAKNRVDDAKATVAQLERLSMNTPASYAAGFNTARDMFTIGILVANARIADAVGKSDDALTLLRDAITKEDQAAYDEPSDWFLPVRHIFGAELLKAGKAEEAEAVYRKDLELHPNNGWALYGLVKALKDQNKDSDASQVEKRFQQAWSRADVTLTASAY